MDRKRQAAWEAALAKQDRGEEVPSEEHYDLLREGLFKGMNKVDAGEEARYVVRYWTHGVSLDPIRGRGQAEANNWFKIGETWGEERQTEKLRAMIEASEHDPDYFDALNSLCVQFHEKAEPFPDALAAWAIAFHKDERPRPPKRQSNKGEPHYANVIRNSWFATTFELLRYLGLGKMDSYAAIAEVFGLDSAAVANAIRAYRKSDHTLPAPWECWPPSPNLKPIRK